LYLSAITVEAEAASANSNSVNYMSRINFLDCLTLKIEGLRNSVISWKTWLLTVNLL